MKFMFAFFLLALSVTSCGRRSDKEQQKLTGTWVADLPDGVYSTTIVRSDGSFSGRLDYTNGKVITFEGRSRIEGDFLVDTYTKHSQTNVQVPFVLRGYILHMDSHEIIAKWEGSFEDETVMRKVEP